MPALVAERRQLVAHSELRLLVLDGAYMTPEHLTLDDLREMAALCASLALLFGWSFELDALRHVARFHHSERGSFEVPLQDWEERCVFEVYLRARLSSLLRVDRAALLRSLDEEEP